MVGNKKNKALAWPLQSLKHVMSWVVLHTFFRLDGPTPSPCNRDQNCFDNTPKPITNQQHLLLKSMVPKSNALANLIFLIPEVVAWLNWAALATTEPNLLWAGYVFVLVFTAGSFPIPFPIPRDLFFVWVFTVGSFPVLF